MHSDWLETLTTYGVAGFILMAMTFAALIFAPFNRHQWPARNAFIILAAIGLGSCLLHATLDFPFQIYSIQHLFVVLAALYSTSSRQA
jgi:O-antigen ligase